MFIYLSEINNMTAPICRHLLPDKMFFLLVYYKYCNIEAETYLKLKLIDRLRATRRTSPDY